MGIDHARGTPMPADARRSPTLNPLPTTTTSPTLAMRSSSQLERSRVACSLARSIWLAFRMLRTSRLIPSLCSLGICEGRPRRSETGSGALPHPPCRASHLGARRTATRSCSSRALPTAPGPTRPTARDTCEMTLRRCMASPSGQPGPEASAPGTPSGLRNACSRQRPGAHPTSATTGSPLRGRMPWSDV